MKETIALLARLEERLNQNTLLERFRYIRQDMPFAYRTDYDDSAFTPLNGQLEFNKSHEVTWIRFDIRVPEQMLGVPTKGCRLRIMSVFQAPIKVYANGELIWEERSWSDFRCPEMVIREAVEPGDHFVMAIRVESGNASFCKGGFFVETCLDRIDEVRNDLANMRAELRYLETIGIPESDIAVVTDALVPLCEVEACKRSGEEIRPILAKARQAGEFLRAKAKKNTVYMVGHAHIDMNWLWPMAETKDLIRRDFSTVCDMMDDYSEFRFSQSQCGAYDICEREFPEVFARVSEKIREGRWEPTATSWVENDNNMASSETAARQVLYSKKYLKEKLDINPDIMWAPDTFGHSANTPQALKESGIENYFFMRCGKQDDASADEVYGYATKVSDYPIAWWEGLDGSRVLAANLNYNGEYRADAILQIVKSNLRQDIHNSLYIYGVGDHGGAPTRRDILRALEMAKSPLFPEIILSTVKQYFDAVRTESEKIPVHRGEKNFVFEGCYTTHGDLKRAVRHLEQTLQKTEQIALYRFLNGQDYPGETIEAGWRTLLFHQFHDIFDGCAIAQTYREALETLQQQEDVLESLCQKMLSELPGQSDWAVINTTPYRRDILVKVPCSGVTVLDGKGTECPVQQGTDGVYAKIGNVAPFSIQPLILRETELPAPARGIREDVAFYHIENDYYAVSVCKENGAIYNFYDKISRRWLCQDRVECWSSNRGILNLFAVYQEVPEYMSAWTIGKTKSVDYLMDGAKTFIREDGELIKIISVVHRYNCSEIRQDIIFEQNSPLIRFETQVEWRELGSMYTSTPALRVVFEPQIANRAVMNEIPFGVLERPNCNAEYPNQRFSAVCDETGGLAVFNDCKYGIKCGGNRLEPTLIRSGWDPDEYADIGSHWFCYAVMAFAGSPDEARVTEYAAACSSGSPLLAQSGSGCELPFALTVPRNVIVSGLKLSEDGKAIVVRMYEAFGKPASILFGNGALRVSEADFNEEPKSALNSADPILLRPYEIKTFRICFQNIVY